jgi:hypothetical protein
MGASSGIHMCFNLAELVHNVKGLEVLAEPFSKDEMDQVVAKMPVDKSPGPDGFNGLFMKKCWPIIKEDFYTLANDFFHDKVSLENINSSFITLVPKKPSPEGINDYRPISLTNSCLEFLSNMVADRL